LRWESAYIIPHLTGNQDLEQIEKKENFLITIPEETFFSVQYQGGNSFLITIEERKQRSKEKEKKRESKEKTGCHVIHRFITKGLKKYLETRNW
jgi:hypothetical protein